MQIGSHLRPVKAQMASTDRLRVAILVVGIVLVPTTTANDGGDDFSNNLLSDLAPILTLFGDQVTKQFMSQSMGWADNIIFAMAPLGIITAVVGAIRVGGPTWLKAIIGRAREHKASAEVELTSSTSHDVCELWNGQTIVRMVGSAPILDLIYIRSLRNGETCGLFTLEEAKAQGVITLEKRSSIYPNKFFDIRLTATQNLLDVSKALRTCCCPVTATRKT